MSRLGSGAFLAHRSIGEHPILLPASSSNVPDLSRP